jgi:hypothetical protein
MELGLEQGSVSQSCVKPGNLQLNNFQFFVYITKMPNINSKTSMKDSKLQDSVVLQKTLFFISVSESGTLRNSNTICYL